jgi:hypothetical protein
MELDLFGLGLVYDCSVDFRGNAFSLLLVVIPIKAATDAGNTPAIADTCCPG